MAQEIKLLFRAIRKRRVFVHSEDIRDYMKDALKPLGAKIGMAFRVIVANWEEDYRFPFIPTITFDGISITGWVVSSEKGVNRWRWVEEGTEPHLIAASRTSYLRFKWAGKGSYHPKTLPGGKFGGIGRIVPATAPIVAILAVDHPGSEPRNFAGEIRRNILPEFRRETENAWRRAIRRWG